MPSTLGAVLVLLYFVVPGYLLRSGYLRSRARTNPDAGLYALAEAVVGSLLLLALLWPWHGREVLTWAQQRTLLTQDHADTTYSFSLALFGSAYFVGLAGGWTVGALLTGLEKLRRSRAGSESQRKSPWVRLFRALDSSGLIRHATVWDETWLRLRAEKRFWVKVTRPDGVEVYGLFADQSHVGTSPAPRQIYLERVFHKKDDGSYAEVANGRGIYLDSEHIATIEFAEAP